MKKQQWSICQNVPSENAMIEKLPLSHVRYPAAIKEICNGGVACSLLHCYGLNPLWNLMIKFLLVEYQKCLSTQTSNCTLANI